MQATFQSGQPPNDFERKLQLTNTVTAAPEQGLPTGCFAPVDSPLCALDGAASCPQASPVDNPKPELCHLRKTETSTVCGTGASPVLQPCHLIQSLAVQIFSAKLLYTPRN